MIIQHINNNTLMLLIFILLITILNVLNNMYKRICLKKERLLRLYVVLTIVIWIIILGIFFDITYEIEGLIGIYEYIYLMNGFIPMGCIIYGVVRLICYVPRDIAANGLRNKCIEECAKYEAFHYCLSSHTIKKSDISKINEIVLEIFDIIDSYLYVYRSLVEMKIRIKYKKKSLRIFLQVDPANYEMFSKMGDEKRTIYKQVIAQIWELLNELSQKYNGKDDENIFSNSMLIELKIPFENSEK